MVFAWGMSHASFSSSLPAHGGDIWTAARQVAGQPDSQTGGSLPGQPNVLSAEWQDFSTNTFIRMAARTTQIMEGVLIAHAHSKKFLHYPDPHMHDLRHTLAQYEALDSANILPGSGASELIWAVLTALRPRKALFIGPLFSQYARACDALGIAWEVLTPDIDTPVNIESCGFRGAFAPHAGTMAQVAESRHNGVDLIIACSPNNPGTAVMHDPLPLLQAVGDRILLLDASYKDFQPSAHHAHYWPNLQSLSAGRVIVLGSLTKFFCCPGVRLGWVAAEANLIERIAQCRPAWTMPALAQEAGMVLLEHAAEYRAALPFLQNDVTALTTMLASTSRFSPIFSGVSFAIAQTKIPGAARHLREYLLSRGILIRVCDNIPGMPPDFVRIQAQAPAHCHALRDSLPAFFDAFMIEN